MESSTLGCEPSEPPMSTVAVTGARRIAWVRRRRALAQAWRDYRASWPGLIGLGMLVLIVAMALAAPQIANHNNLDPSKTLNTPL